MTERSSEARGSFRDRIVDDYSGYKVYDQDGGKLGKVEYTVLDDGDQPEYLGLKTGFFGSNVTLIPESLIRLNDSGDFEVQATESQVNDAPNVGDEDDVSPDFEDRVREHYGLGRSGSGQGSSDTEAAVGTAGAADGATNRDRDSDYDRGSDHDRDSDRDVRGESRNRDEGRDHDEGRDYGRDRDQGRDHDSERSGSSTGAAAAGAAGGAAAASGSSDRDRNRDDHDTEYHDGVDVESRGGHSDSRRGGGEKEGEKIRVTLKREEARAERIIDEDGEEEVRIRKRTIKEETLVDVEDEKDMR